MRFFKKKYVEPKVGDKKEITKFAFFPVRIDEETTVWLEKYIQVYVAEKRLKAFPTAVGMYGIWLAYETRWVIEWVEHERKLKRKTKL
ncbi:MAG: hypothetical protein AABY15_02990 [Nanoarchaeota archaeon]